LRARVRTHDEVELLEHLKGIKDPLVLVLDCVQDPHNLGACLRTADAAGVDAVIVPQRRSATITETVRKIACGGAEHVFFVQVVNLVRTLEHLQEAGLFVYGTSHTADKSIYEENLTGPLALVLGAEATGVRRLTAETCDGLVSIPMGGTVECLNVSVATGVCLFEARRQRKKSR
jgi:23S rRNA (guanosine2251-2'-O)-methyltransferase